MTCEHTPSAKMPAAANISELIGDDDRAWAEAQLPKLTAKFAAERDRVGSRIPYIAQDGLYREFEDETFIRWWTNGFWPGILWQMRNATGDEAYTAPARGVEAKLDRVFDDNDTDHDAGFMWLLSAVADWRATGNQQSRTRGLHAANLLISRFNPVGRFLRAWNEQGREGWAIIDSMMNIPLLFWAAHETGDPRYVQVATMHADTLLEHVIRPDGSCNHIVCFDPLTGEFEDNPGGQGYESGSSWTRGQAWAIYGFALAARNSGEVRYLDAAKRVAHYFCANVALSGDLTPIDFRQPAEPEYRDALAAVIAACGLMEVAEQVPELERALYVRWAVRILKAVEANWCDWDPAHDGLVQCCSGSYHSEPDREVPMVYGDYYYVEAVLRLAGKAMRLWDGE